MKEIDKLKIQLAGIFSVILLASGFGLAAYEVSYKKGKISAEEFTVSQSLAHSDNPVLLTLLTLGTAAYVYLLYARGPKDLLFLRIFLQVVIYALVISLLWVKPWVKYLSKHRILAAVIFFTTLVYHILTYQVFKSVSPLVKNLLLLAVILNVLAFIGIVVSRLPMLSKYKESYITFASLENTCTLITGSVILIIALISTK